MDDTCSVVDSIYWDTQSITSGSTIPNSCYETPIGSKLDLYKDEIENGIPGEEFSIVQTEFTNLSLNDKMEAPEIVDSEIEITTDEPVFSSECANNIQRHSVVPMRPPPIKLQKYASTQLDTSSKSTEKKDWRRSFVMRVSFTKSKILKSLSMNKQVNKSQSNSNVLLNMRNSIRRLKSFNKRKSTGNLRTEKETIKDTLGSDCDQFNIERSSSQRNSLSIDEVFDVPVLESIPIKPRRQFPQDKYLTGSEEVLQRAYNSLIRKSQVQENKSIFDLCSTLIHLFEFEDDESKTSDNVPSFIGECLDAFLEMNGKQISFGLLQINRNLGKHFNLYSEKLDAIGQSKTFKIEELLGSNGVCVITDLGSKEKFVALKRSTPSNWVSFTSFLQYIDKDNDSSWEFPVGQTWVCFPADSITNMYLERDCFEERFSNSKFILHTLFQLLVLLRSQILGEYCCDIKPSNVLLISSNLSLICVFDNSGLLPEKDERALSTVNLKDDENMRQIYQQSLMELNEAVHSFLCRPANSSHLITASYPLDYLFYILLKLHRDINGLLDNP